MTPYLLICALLAAMFLAGWLWLLLIAGLLLLVATAWAISAMVQGARNLWDGVFRRF